MDENNINRCIKNCKGIKRAMLFPPKEVNSKVIGGIVVESGVFQKEKASKRPEINENNTTKEALALHYMLGLLRSEIGFSIERSMTDTSIIENTLENVGIKLGKDLAFKRNQRR